MSSSVYRPLFLLAKERTSFGKLTSDGVSVVNCSGRRMLRIEPDLLSMLAEKAFHDVSFFFAKKHLMQLAEVAGDASATENDRFVARSLLQNAVIASEGVFPICQDTGTANIIAYRGHDVITGCDDAELLSNGVAAAYSRNYLRFSQLSPLGMFDEADSGNNLPAQIDIQSVPGMEYNFLFIAKGGGSSNKTFLFQESKALLSDEQSFMAFLTEKIKAIGVAACPPYHIAVVVGGMSPEFTLKTVKMATAGALDNLITCPTGFPQAYRDLYWEEKILKATREFGLGAQFGGVHFALDVIVIRLPRHAGSLPVGIGVSCNAHRNIRAKITATGVYLEKLVKDPSPFAAKSLTKYIHAKNDCRIDLDCPIDEIASQLSRHAPGSLVILNGSLIVARDIAHSRFWQMLKDGKPLPEYFLKHAVYYAGPARTPKGWPSGSFGPTTAQRMDSYVPEFMKHGASRIMLAKGNRSQSVVDACVKYNGFYLGTIGGAAALVAKNNIVSSEILDFGDLGMEAVRKLKVKDFPAFIICDNKGRKIY